MAKKKKTPKSSQQNPKNCVEKSSSKNADEKNPLGSNSHQMTKRDRQQSRIESSFNSIRTTNSICIHVLHVCCSMFPFTRSIRKIIDAARI